MGEFWVAKEHLGGTTIVGIGQGVLGDPCSGYLARADLIKTLGTAIQRYVGGSFLAEPVFKPLMGPG